MERILFLVWNWYINRFTGSVISSKKLHNASTNRQWMFYVEQRQVMSPYCIPLKQYILFTSIFILPYAVKYSTSILWSFIFFISFFICSHITVVRVWKLVMRFSHLHMFTKMRIMIIRPTLTYVFIVFN